MLLCSQWLAPTYLEAEALSGRLEATRWWNLWVGVHTALRLQGSELKVNAKQHQTEVKCRSRSSFYKDNWWVFNGLHQNPDSEEFLAFQEYRLGLILEISLIITRICFFSTTVHAQDKQESCPASVVPMNFQAIEQHVVAPEKSLKIIQLSCSER